jgi:hypothetical protein
MKKIPCQYAIVRFTPFIETGEFANVGIVMMAPNEHYFGFKLLKTRRHGRITKFFEELDAKVFRAAMADLNEELGRVHDVLKAHWCDKRPQLNDGIEFAKNLFAEMIRPREAIVRFSEPRAVLAEGPTETLNNLFAFYVERDFVTKEYRETVLEKGLHKLFVKEKVAENFQKKRLGDDGFSVSFPFVELHNERTTKLIKPLNLAQTDSTKILEHGGKWEFRIRELKKRRVFPEKALFAVEGPTTNGRRENAYRETVEMLQNTGVEVLPYTNTDKILEFVLNG